MQALTRFKTPIFVLSALLAGALMTTAIQYVRADTGTTYYACVRQTLVDGSPNIRIVSASTPCKSGETRISWNQTGPQGPVGPAGPQGPQGPAGSGGSGYISDLSHADFTDGDIRYQDLSHRDLSHAIFVVSATEPGAATNISFVDFSYSDLSSAQMQGSCDPDCTDLAANGATFDHALLPTNTTLVGINFTGATFVGVDLSGDTFQNVNFFQADLHTANLASTSWIDTICPDGSLSSFNDDGTCLGHL